MGNLLIGFLIDTIIDEFPIKQKQLRTTDAHSHEKGFLLIKRTQCMLMEYITIWKKY